MSYEPAYSPWGLIQTRKTLCPGFFDVSTASHGGIMVAREFVAGNLSPTAQRYGFWEGGYLCFEEDSDAQIVLRELWTEGFTPRRSMNTLAPENTANVLMIPSEYAIPTTGGRMRPD